MLEQRDEKTSLQGYLPWLLWMVFRSFSSPWDPMQKCSICNYFSRVLVHCLNQNLNDSVLKTNPVICSSCSTRWKREQVARVKAVNLVLRWDFAFTKFLLIAFRIAQVSVSILFLDIMYSQNCVTHFLNCRFFTFLMLTILNEQFIQSHAQFLMCNLLSFDNTYTCVAITQIKIQQFSITLNLLLFPVAGNPFFSPEAVTIRISTTGDYLGWF